MSYPSLVLQLYNRELRHYPYPKKPFQFQQKVFDLTPKKKNVLKVNKITKNCGWCDDITSDKYNKYIKISDFQSLNINYEKLWREDEAYDIIIVTSHNVEPTIRNKGSAIFIHCSQILFHLLRVEDSFKSERFSFGYCFL